jgi:hypothetical protein
MATDNPDLAHHLLLMKKELDDKVQYEFLDSRLKRLSLELKKLGY